MQTAIGVESCTYTTSNASLLPLRHHIMAFLYASVLLLFFLLLFFSPLSGSATVVIPVSEDDLALHATAVLIGQVKTIESYWDKEARQVFTNITLTPQEILKGEINRRRYYSQTVRGTFGHLRSWVDGSPEFRVGEKVLLFLDTNPDGSACVAHLYQGKFSLFTDRDTGKEFAYRGETPEGVRLLTDGRTGRAQRPPPPVSSMK